jgi:hypothetical protein
MPALEMNWSNKFIYYFALIGIITACTSTMIYKYYDSNWLLRFSRRRVTDISPKNRQKPSKKEEEDEILDTSPKIFVCFCEEEQEDWIGLSIDHVFKKCDYCLKKDEI